MTLDEQVQALKDAERGAEPPADVRRRVMEAFDAHHAAQSPVPASLRPATWPPRPRVFAAAALAAGVVLGVGGTVVYFQRADPVLPAAAVGESVVFVLEPSGVQETVRVMRIRVARSALESLGISTLAAKDAGAPGSGTVEVDVLVGEDGVARGVRLAM